ncbi:MAG: H(+)-transporting ATPase [Verrucomicrobia bacterium]|nr:MAG: H(+)-transporting ATPase [Verrucomicrobiota bacterium]
MKITKQAKREAKQLFRSCTTDSLLDPGRVRQALQRVLETKPRGYLAILSHFERLLKLDMERRTAKIESATPLPADLQSSIKAGLEHQYGPGLNFSFNQNTALIGGLRIKVGSDVYDGSVQGRLTALEESF